MLRMRTSFLMGLAVTGVMATQAQQNSKKTQDVKTNPRFQVWCDNGAMIQAEYYFAGNEGEFILLNDMTVVHMDQENGKLTEAVSYFPGHDQQKISRPVTEKGLSEPIAQIMKVTEEVCKINNPPLKQSPIVTNLVGKEFEKIRGVLVSHMPL